MNSVKENDSAFTISPENDSKQETVKKRKRWWHIDKQMIPYKLHYFLYTAGLGTTGPFVAVYAKTHLGCSAVSFATIITFTNISVMMLNPLVGFVVDYFNKLKTALCIFCVIQSALAFAYFRLPPIPLQTPSYENDTNCDSPLHSNNSYSLCSRFKNSRNITSIERFYFTNKDLCETISNYNSSSSFLCNIKIPDSKCYYSLNVSSDYGESRVRKCNNFGNMSEMHVSFDSCLPHSTEIQNLYFSGSGIENQSLPVEANLEAFFCVVNGHTILGNERCMCIKTFDTKSDLNQPFFLCLICRFFTNSTNATDAFDDICHCHSSSDYHFIPQNISKIYLPGTTTYKSITFYFRIYQFWLIAAVFSSIRLCTFSIFVLSNTACCEGVTQRGADYGKQRVFGPIGWGLMSGVSGFLSDYTHGYMTACIVQAIFYVAVLLNISRLDLVKPKLSRNYTKDIGSVLKSKSFLSFAFGTFINGIGNSLIWSFLLWFLVSIGGDTTVFGLVHTVQNIAGEIPFMFFSGWIIRKVGHFHVSTLTMFMFFVRFIWYSQLQNPWLVLPIEWAHGITYGLFYTSMVTFAKKNAKPGMETTTQAVFSAFNTLGMVVGNIVAGISIDRFGGHQTFFYFSLFFCACSVTSFVLTLLFRKKNKPMALNC